MPKPIVPVLAFLGVLGMALLMIAGMVVRPWELPQVRQVSLSSPTGYSRSLLSYVGSDRSIGWQHADDATSVQEPGTSMVSTQPPTGGEYSGRDYFIAYGCASCHGLDGRGTRWAPMRITAAEQVHMMVRVGPKGMPAYSKEYLPDSIVNTMAAWLVAQAPGRPATTTPPAQSTTPAPAPTTTVPIPTTAPVSGTPATTTPATTTTATTTPATTSVPQSAKGDPQRGEDLYGKLGCASCHGKGGKGTAFAPAMFGAAFAQKYHDDPPLADVIRKGKGMMAGYDAAKLPDSGLADLIAYLRSLE